MRFWQKRSIFILHLLITLSLIGFLIAQQPAVRVRYYVWRLKRLSHYEEMTERHFRVHQELADMRKLSAKHLLPLLKHTDPEVRRNAVSVLSATSHPLLSPAMTGMLKDRNPRVRTTAAALLGELYVNTPERVVALLDLLDDPDEHVRRASAATLGRILGQGFRYHDEAPTEEDRRIVRKYRALFQDGVFLTNDE